LAVEVSKLWVTPLSASTPMWAFMPKYRKHPVETALACWAGIRGDRDDVVIDVVNDGNEICADQAAILLSEFPGSGFQFEGSSS
jgi:hypothetical protein